MPFRFFDALVSEISDRYDYDCNPYNHVAILLVACQAEKITNVVRQWRICLAKIPFCNASIGHNRRLRDETIGDAGHEGPDWIVSARRLERECGAVIDALTVARVNTGRHSLRVPCADFAADSGLGGMVEGFCGSALLVDHDQRHLF